VGEVRYDPNELRRCIAFCFSASELRALCEGMGAEGIGGFDRGAQEAAREVVRHFEKLGQLDRLVAKLKEAKPLVEWPAPLPAEEQAFQPPAITAQPAAEVAPPPAAAAPEAAPAAAPEAAPAAAPEAAPAPVTAPAPAPAPAPAAAPAPPPAAPTGPIIRDPYAPAFPGTAPRAAAPTGVRGPVVIAVFGALVLLGVSFVIYLVLTRANKFEDPNATAAASASASARPPRPRRPSGIARIAADTMDRSLANLARACEIPAGDTPGAGLFKTAYEQCGARSQPGRPNVPRPTSTGSGSTPSTPTSTPGAADDPAPPSTPDPSPPSKSTAPSDATPRTARTGAPTTTKPADNGAADACLGKCASAQHQCNDRCGPEPKESSKYGQWQGCQAQCLSAASKCRLACQ
jgi:hypothetical protein